MPSTHLAVEGILSLSFSGGGKCRIRIHMLADRYAAECERTACVINHHAVFIDRGDTEHVGSSRRRVCRFHMHQNVYGRTAVPKCARSFKGDRVPVKRRVLNCG